MNILFGLLIAVSGFSVVWKTEWIIQNFGTNTWAEEHLGSDGGTRLFYKLIGIVLIIAGFALITGLLQPLLLGFLSPLFSGMKS